MVDVIEPTQAELISWVVILIAIIIFCTFLWIKGKQEEDRTVKWVRDLKEKYK